MDHITGIDCTSNLLNFVITLYITINTARTRYNQYLPQPPLAQWRVHGERHHWRHRLHLRPRGHPHLPQRLLVGPLAHVVHALCVADEVDRLAQVLPFVFITVHFVACIDYKI